MSSETISETGKGSRPRDRAEHADYAWLVGKEAADWLLKIADDAKPIHAWVAQLRGHLSAVQTHLLLELADLRTRAEAKFDAAGRMYFTRVALEQATDQWIAAYKAERFAGRSMVADLCSGIGGDLLSLATRCRVRGVDVDPVATLLAQANSRVVLGDSHPIELDSVNCEELNLDGVDAWHMDPDRRNEGRRTTSLDYCRPSRHAIERLVGQVPHAAVKLAPATRVPESWESRCELEWISRDRECRQLVAWHGDLATCPGERRATIVTATRPMAKSHSIVGWPSTPPIAEKLGDFLIEPDPAVLAAGLTGALAERHQLAAIAHRVAYLTGPNAVDDDLVQCFAIREIIPYQLKAIRQCLRHHDVGQLEVKKRGVRIDPEQLRKQLRPDGNRPATLIVTRIAERTVVIVAERI